MEATQLARLVAVDPAWVCGLIEEHVTVRMAEVEPGTWARELARWDAVRGALVAAAEGARPASPRDRAPRWLQAVARAQLDRGATRWPSRDAAMNVRVLERLGLVELEHDDTYVLAMAAGVVGDPRHTRLTRSEVLRADPELREAIIWRLFEVEGGGEVSLANLDKFTRDPRRQWSTTFHELVADGTLDRGRVLRAALGALTRDFSSFRAGWFSRLHGSFDPTPHESAEHQDVLRHLLRSDVRATTALAVRTLTEVSRAGLLDDDATARVLGAALRAEARTTAEAALRLAEAITGGRPDLCAVVAGQIASGLTHPHPQVQLRAAQLLRSLGADDLLARQVESLTPTVATALGLEISPPAPVAPSGPPGTSGQVARGPRATSADAHGRAQGDELVERMAGLLEDAGDAVEVEAVIAALALAGQTDVLARLDRRAATVLVRGPRERVTHGWLRGQLARLVRRSAGHDVPPLSWTWAPATGRWQKPPEQHLALGFLARRLDEVTDVVLGSQPPGALLATPAHRAGWIDPDVLVTRFLAGPVRSYDLVAALLRLAPDGRSAALHALDRSVDDEGTVVPAEALAAVRHALGAPALRSGSGRARRGLDGAQRAWWTAAARARDPFGTDPWVMSLGLGGAGRAEPLDLRLGTPTVWPSGAGSTSRRHGLPWIIASSPAPQASDDQPTAVGRDDRDRAAWDDAEDAEDYVPWVATTWPADAEHLAWVAGLAVADCALAGMEVRHDAVRVLGALREHEGRLGRLSRAVLAAGLSGGTVEQRVRAVDAVAAQAAAGRLDAVGLAGGIVDIGPVTPLTRTAGSLRDLAAIDPGFVIDTLASALPQVPTDARGVHSLLAVLLDELIRSARPTPPTMAAWLSGFGGGSVAARTASQLRQRTTST